MRNIGIILFIVAIALVGCNTDDNAISDKKNIENLIGNEISYDIHEIIYKDEVSDEILMVLYTVGDVFDDGDSNADYLNVAFLKGNQKLGWTFLGDKDWAFDNNGIMQVYEDTIHYTENGELKDISVIYGQILDSEIVSVKVGNEEHQYIDADIVEKNGERYFYHVYNVKWGSIDESKGSNGSNLKNIGVYGLMAKGITKDGLELIHQGGN